jgi:hypothetical protein
VQQGGRKRIGFWTCKKVKNNLPLLWNLLKQEKV